MTPKTQKRLDALQEIKSNIESHSDTDEILKKLHLYSLARMIENCEKYGALNLEKLPLIVLQDYRIATQDFEIANGIPQTFRTYSEQERAEIKQKLENLYQVEFEEINNIIHKD